VAVSSSASPGCGIEPPRPARRASTPAAGLMRCVSRARDRGMVRPRDAAEHWRPKLSDLPRRLRGWYGRRCMVQDEAPRGKPAVDAAVVVREVLPGYTPPVRGLH